MTIAEIHGKLSDTDSNREDYLTANVFTAFRYLPAEIGIIGFLRTIPGLKEHIPALSPTASCQVHFWPKGRSREPDVLLDLDINGTTYHVSIEAKYHSGPSDYEASPTEQEREIADLGEQPADHLRSSLVSPVRH